MQHTNHFNRKMPTIETRTKTEEQCPNCNSNKLEFIKERWEPFPEDTPKYFESKRCSCGYKYVIKDERGIVNL